jgi:hypothetical protein
MLGVNGFVGSAIVIGDGFSPFRCPGPYSGRTGAGQIRIRTGRSALAWAVACPPSTAISTS